MQWSTGNGRSETRNDTLRNTWVPPSYLRKENLPPGQPRVHKNCVFCAVNSAELAMLEIVKGEQFL